MNFLELKDEVEILVDDPSAVIMDRIPGVVNEAVLAVANAPGIVLPGLKALYTSETVLGQAYLTLPDNNAEKLLFVSAVDSGTPISVNNTLEDLLGDYPTLTEEGDVEAVALEGSTLWYHKIPSLATPLLVLYYKKPEVLTLDTDIPSVIPEHLHRKTIVPYAGMILYNLIEDGIEGEKVNTAVQMNFHDQGIIELREYLAARRRGRHHSVWSV